MTMPPDPDWDDARPLRVLPAEEFEVRLSAYDGALRGLVEAVEARKLDADAVPLEDVCAQYETYAAALPEEDLQRRAEPVPLAARVTEIRAARLAGRAFTDGAKDSRRERPEREPESVAKVRTLAAALDARERRGRDVFGNGRHRRRADGSVVRVPVDVDLDVLFREILDRSAPSGSASMATVPDDVANAMLDEALDAAPAGTWHPLSSIGARSPHPAALRYAAVLRAALDRAAAGEVRLRQTAVLSPIEVAACKPNVIEAAR